MIPVLLGLALMGTGAAYYMRGVCAANLDSIIGGIVVALIGAGLCLAGIVGWVL